MRLQNLMDPCVADAYLADGAIFANRIMMNEVDPAVRKAHHTALAILETSSVPPYHKKRGFVLLSLDISDPRRSIVQYRLPTRELLLSDNP